MTLAPLRRMRDPTKARRLARRFEKNLVALFRRYKTAAVDALTIARENEARALEPTPIQIAWLVDELDVLSRETILAPGEVIVTEGVKTGYRQGALYGELALARGGISSKLGEGPADWRVIDVLQARNLSALKGISTEMNKQIVSELTEGINRGEGVVKLAQRLRARVDGIGITRARAMAHYETMYACNEGAKLRYSQHGVRRVEGLAALHGNTCEQCLAYHGKIFDIDKAPTFPLHPFCRCTWLPVIEDPT